MTWSLPWWTSNWLLPSSRNSSVLLVHQGKLQVIGGVHDLAGGQIKWLARIQQAVLLSGESGSSEHGHGEAHAAATHGDLHAAGPAAESAARRAGRPRRGVKPRRSSRRTRSGRGSWHAKPGKAASSHEAVASRSSEEQSRLSSIEEKSTHESHQQPPRNP